MHRVTIRTIAASMLAIAMAGSAQAQIACEWSPVLRPLCCRLAKSSWIFDGGPK